MLKTTSTVFFTALVALGCSDTGDSAGLSVQAVSSAGSEAPEDLVMIDDSSVDYGLLSAHLHLRDIELDLPDGKSCSDVDDSLGGGVVCDDSDSSDKIVVAGPFDVDLVAGTATPSLDDVLIPVGTYKRIDFRVEDNANDVSFAVVANFEHQGDAMTLDLALDFNEDIRIEDPAGLTVDADTDLIAQFVVSDWLVGVDIGQCIDDGDVAIDGTTVTIDDGSTSGDCSAIEDTIKSNMKNSGQLD